MQQRRTQRASLENASVLVRCLCSVCAVRQTKLLPSSSSGSGCVKPKHPRDTLHHPTQPYDPHAASAALPGNAAVQCVCTTCCCCCTAAMAALVDTTIYMTRAAAAVIQPHCDTHVAENIHTQRPIPEIPTADNSSISQSEGEGHTLRGSQFHNPKAAVMGAAGSRI